MLKSYVKQSGTLLISFLFQANKNGSGDMAPVVHPAGAAPVGAAANVSPGMGSARSPVNTRFPMSMPAGAPAAPTLPAELIKQVAFLTAP